MFNHPTRGRSPSYSLMTMPFGLSNTPATFERMIDSVLGGLKRKTCLCYLDDIFVFSTTFQEQITRLSEVLKWIASAGLQMSAKKCGFASRGVTVFRHLVRQFGISPDSENIRAVIAFCFIIYFVSAGSSPQRKVLYSLQPPSNSRFSKVSATYCS